MVVYILIRLVAMAVFLLAVFFGARWIINKMIIFWAERTERGKYSFWTTPYQKYLKKRRDRAEAERQETIQRKEEHHE